MRALAVPAQPLVPLVGMATAVGEAAPDVAFITTVLAACVARPVSGKLPAVALVRAIAEGVPRFGVVIAQPVVRHTLPDPDVPSVVPQADPVVTCTTPVPLGYG